MSGYWECHYHVVWATKHRAAIIDSVIEPLIVELITTKSNQLGCPLLGINMVSDHVHVAATIPPGVDLFEWIKAVKGYSSFETNKAYPNRDNALKWQSGYGLFSVGTRELPIILEYIRNQKHHHRHNTWIEAYERTTD